MDIARWRLCVGCGACASVCPHGRISLRDFPEEGIRPILQGGDCRGCDLCLQACPMVETSFPEEAKGEGAALGLGPGWGPVLEIWEGHASDPAFRFNGASGGVLTALSAFCLEVLAMRGVLHTGANPEDPIRNLTRLSRTREELMASSGSRYSPASVCDGLELVEAEGGPCAFVGRPVEVAALKRVCKLLPELERRVGAVFSFFCAEAPATLGTLELLGKLGVDPGQVELLRYRGRGWPGEFAVFLKGQSEPRVSMSYWESWSFLQAYRPWASHLWPDGTGEFADITCGDPWYMAPDGENPGESLVVVRTRRGMELLRGAMEEGYLELRPAEPWKLIESQRGLIAKKKAVCGRLLAVRLFGLPVPRFKGGRLLECWMGLSAKDKTRSILGTVRRILVRKLYRKRGQADFSGLSGP